MPEVSFAAELARYGPDTSRVTAPPLAEAEKYCRRLARTHYENFLVGSWLLPRALRSHFYNLYAYCRWSDDLADETASGDQSRALLDWWESQLHACYQGRAVHPVFVALRTTIEQFSIPEKVLGDLLVAFRQDQTKARYETIDELLEYCRYSANPVGRLVLYLGKAMDEGRAVLSDAICTGLQLTNFWQDVARDWEKGRVYLPRQTLADCGYDEEMLAGREYNSAFRQAMAGEVDRAESYLRRGAALVEQVPQALQLEVALFVAGGRAVLEAIRQIDYDVWSHRPTISKWQQMRLFLQCWWHLRGAGPRGR